MNQHTIKGQWKQLAGTLKKHWGKLTGDDLKVAEGNAEYITGKLVQSCGMAHAAARARIRAFERSLRH